MAKKQALSTTSPIDPQELELTQQAGSAIASFLKGTVAFFTTARALESQALETLEAAKALTVPAGPEEDEQVQIFIKRANADKKAVESHWSITSTVHQLHRRLTARRDKAAKPLEEASLIANFLHNRYDELERQRAAREQEALRRKAEAEAQAERDAELARLEAEALKAEENSPDLSERESKFVSEILKGGQDAACAFFAGYKNATATSKRLLATPKIIKAIDAARKAVAAREQAAAVKDAPLDVAPVELVKPNVTKADGASTRTTWKAELLDESALIAAVLSGKAPLDLLQINPTKLNDYARSMHELIDRWPGVKAVKTTKTF